MQTVFDTQFPTRILHGPSSIQQVGTHFQPGERVLIVTDQILVDIGTVDALKASLQSAGILYSIYIRPGSRGKGIEPTPNCVSGGYRQYKGDGCSAIVGLGGGSPMDVAKMVGILASNGGRIRQYVGQNNVGAVLPKLICIPTTYGTGSEVTPFAVLSNDGTHNKDPIISWKIAPQVAVLDPCLSVSLPFALGAHTGMDALTHAIESYLSLMATPITEAMALGAINLIGENMRSACSSDSDLKATENMLIASTLAGLAFSQTRLGNVHAMSHPVGGRYHLHHGLTNAVILPFVMDYNVTSCVEKYVQIAQALGQPTQHLSSRDAAQLAIDAVRQMNSDLNIPQKLGDLGVKKSAIKTMSTAAMTSGNVAVNPRKTQQADIEAIFSEAI